MKQPLQWVPKLIEVSKLKHTPNNYKIQNEQGLKMLQASLKHFGLAGTIVANTDFVLIDGNSRVKEAREKKQKKIWVSFPNRKMTPKELSDMNAIFDQARAGDVDHDRINKEKGTSADFYKMFGMQMPLEILDKMGKGQAIEKNGKRNKVESSIEELGDDALIPFNMFFKHSQDKKFKEWYPTIQAKLKTQTVTDTVFKCIEAMAKTLKLK